MKDSIIINSMSNWYSQHSTQNWAIGMLRKTRLTLFTGKSGGARSLPKDLETGWHYIASLILSRSHTASKKYKKLIIEKFTATWQIQCNTSARLSITLPEWLTHMQSKCFTPWHRFNKTKKVRQYFRKNYSSNRKCLLSVNCRRQALSFWILAYIVCSFFFLT